MSNGALREEINNVYRESIEDIQFLKQQQWRVANYCLLLFSAIFFLFKFFIYDKNPSLIEYEKHNLKIFFSAVSIAVGLFGLYFQVDFQNMIKKNRKRIDDIRRIYFHQETREIISKENMSNYIDFWRGGTYFLAFFIAVSLAAGFILFLIWNHFLWSFFVTLAMIIWALFHGDYEKVKNKPHITTPQ